ncbi:tetratricopeptide repeat-containing sulfotransferase family protein [Microbulbifer mangrovi]|uniref:tetratricopeptide repeat-containing sulfotransferase family protein n=1 Tax=Microbulbifer mangrovi TaxID=927787 RepID=UPI003B835B72
MRSLHQCCREILQREPGHSDAWFLISIAAAAAGQLNKALEMIERALHKAPRNTEYLSQKARYCAQLNRYAPAIQAADAAMAEKPQRALILDTLGVVYAKFDEHRKAITPLRQAVALSPDNTQFQFNLGSAEQFLGNQDAARSAYRKSIELKPDFARARWALSELEKNSGNTDNRDTLQRALKKPGLSAEDQLYLSHALARNYEQSGKYRDAFSILAEAKSRYQQKAGYTYAQDAELFSAIKSAFPTASTSETDNDLGAGSVFILGMPRSGTTLVEQIVASHSQATTLGELHEFPLILKQHSATSSPHTLSPEVISSALLAAPEKIGNDYLERCRDRGKTSARMIDKLPMNFLYLGFILRSLPKAKIVTLERHPLDVCLSNYRQLFSFNFRYYHYHYSLTDTARYICAYRDLMEHWGAIYGNKIYTVNYEKLIENPEQEARAMMQFLDLPWEQGCLNFHRSENAVSTASSVQIRQPIYRDAVERWRKYEKELTPAIEIFDIAGMI